MEMKEFYYQDGLRVGVFNLDHKAIPYHWHSEVSDMVFCARGQITIELPDSHASYKIDPGEVFQVPCPSKHRFVNSAPPGTMARYVLFQIGTFDINFIPAAKEIAGQFARVTPIAARSAVVYIRDRRHEIFALAHKFERVRPEALTADEAADVVRALRLLATMGVGEPVRVGA